ncbi:DNA polymerase protein [Halorhabdus tiamatea SARL4B]|uniref:DNA polymerase n=1 Tax=Halorhabdus tiamatea SARL4B TaxID=1033806 RepID=F7PMU1_9EURY|nr:DNA polymerase domain-containing protein [Halorhabdus tiamatea]ERJ07648.1 DNA polymerase protein [Halorhabdus tiamatea SARL4B]CCQ32695.1 archaeal DNA polymerase I, intein-containing [Halorhabdus tiamatea SARL4B]
MTDSGEQRGLGEFADGDRPAAEARAVAGNGGHEASVVDAEEWRYPEAEGTVEFEVTQVDYTIEGGGSDEYPVLHVFGRTDDRALVHVQVYEFRPYFYAPAGNVDQERLASYDSVTGWERTGKDGEPYESIRGEHLVRIFGRTPRDVGQIRDDFDHYEADILFPNRLLIDKDITSGVRVPERRTENGTIRIPHDEIEAIDYDAEARVNTFDIEVEDRSGFPEDGEEPIICLTSHDSYRDEYVVWLYDSPVGIDPPEALDRYEPLEDDFEADVRVFDEEEAMLEAFLDYIEETDVDIMTGWNFSDFDAPYFIDRLQELDPGTDRNLDMNRLSRVNEVWESDWQGPDIKGRVVFDLLRAYKRTQFTELDSYRLEDVGQAELGAGKETYTGDIGTLWEDDPERLLEYNLRDVELCVELDRKQDIIAFFEEVASFVGSKLEDAPTPGDAVDMYVLHKAFGNFVLPSKGTVESGEEFEGGAVFEPISGIKEMVSVHDLKSLYPMCMVTINASPETKVDPETYDGETFRAPDPSGQHFRTEPDGIVREMVEELLSEREEKKALRNDHDPGTEAYELYDRQQGAVKVIMNCFTPDTEVLTPAGVQNIRDLNVGDDVYSIDPDTLEVQVKPVTETWEYPEYDGELVDIGTSKIDFSVTPNHRMLVRKNETNGISWDEDDYRFVEAGDLDDATNYQLPHDWSMNHGDPIDDVDLTEWIDGDYEVWVRPSVHGHTFTAELGWTPRRVPKADAGEVGYVFTAEEFEEHREYIESVCEYNFIHRESGRKWIPRMYDGDDFLELLAWYITEGNVYTSEEKDFGANHRGSATTVKIAQQTETVTDGGSPDDTDHAEIGQLLDRMDFDYYVDDRAYQFTSALLGDLLRDVAGEGSAEKHIPEFVFDLDESQKRRFLKTLISGDGDRQTGSWRYTTSSERLRDDILRLCTHLGYTANYNRDSGSWRIYVTEDSKNTLRMHRSAERSRADNGVYSITVADNHTVLAGRNGKFQWVGQSLYGVSGWDRFRLYDKDNAAAVTATGRSVIEYTESAVNDLGYDVTYGDTDSVMISMGTDMSVEDAIDRSFEIEEAINASYDEFARETLQAEEHRFQIEFEKLYRRFFQAGKKKRYAGHIVWKEGKDVDDIDITGFEYQRSDIAPITKRVQKEVLDLIVTEGDVEAVTEYLHDVIEDFQAGNVDVEDVGIPGGIGKRLNNYDTDTAHVRGAKYANLLLGTNFQRGSKPKRLYLKKVHPDYYERIEAERDLDPSRDALYGEFKRDPDVICFEVAEQLPAEFEVDWEKMLEKTLRGPIARVIEALGVSWQEVKSGQEQTGLGQYM